MNKYIKSDIEHGNKYIKSGIMNTLSAIESGEVEEIVLECSTYLVIKYALERKWTLYTGQLNTSYCILTTPSNNYVTISKIGYYKTLIMNTPILTQSEEKIAPWNQKTKCIEVNISQCLSCTTTIEVPADLEYDPVILENYVREQILLPSDLKDLRDWHVDDFCVV